MKKRFLFYSIVLLVVGALGVLIMTSTIETSLTKTPEPTPKSKVVQKAQASQKKKSCFCCADRIGRLKEKVREARERKRTAIEQGAASATFGSKNSRRLN